MKFRVWRSLLMVLLLHALPLLGASAAETKVRLILSADEVRSGETVWAGVHVVLAEGWHTYWRYGGEAAQPPEIDWELPEGVTAGEIQWPAPEKYLQKGIYSYVYHHETVLLVPLSVSATSGELQLKAKFRWLECLEACVPRNQTLDTALMVGTESRRSQDADLIDQWRSKVPRVDSSLQFALQWDGPGEDDERSFTALPRGEDASALVDFYPHAYDDFEVMAPTEVVTGDQGEQGIKKGIFKYDGEWPSQVAGLVALKDPGQTTVELVETVLDFGGAASAGESGSVVGESDTNQVAVVSGGSVSTFKMLCFAFIGGFILNFMPCVLPVIALKILGFVKQSEESPARVKRLGVVYGMGVLASFLVMAGLVVGVQQAGNLASWGMQFQNIGFLIAMMILVTLVALNFFGVYEISLGGSAMGVASRFSNQEGYMGAFFNGVLATILATPCTAPFLATALGFAFAQPPLWIILFFVTIALGLAFPYVLLSLNPMLLKYLPKPGPWMGRFKMAMGFPMLATAVWLYSVAITHFNSGAELWLGLLLVVVALAAWIWGQFVQQVSARRPLSIGLALLIGGGGAWWILERELEYRNPAEGQGLEKGTIVEKGIEWRTWSHAAVAEARSAGHPVLVDFTASWCQNCKANKRFSIEIDPVREKLKALNAVTFRADFSHYDPTIAEELKRYDRAGVPLVLVFAAEETKPVQVLPPLLTPSIVLDALDQASGG